MAEHANPGFPEDNLDIVELVMAVEEVLANPNLTPAEREQLIRELERQITSGEFGDLGDIDDDDLAALVQKLGPRSPHGQSGAEAQPEEPTGE